jgi:hypothetical protein
MWLGTRLFITRKLEDEARAHAEAAAAGHQHTSAAAASIPWWRRFASLDAWSDVAHNFRADWQMLWKEISAGFVIAGFIALLPASFFNQLFITDAPDAIRLLENVIVGPIVAVLSFVCSVGNIPLAAILWAGGISFSGVMAFIYADLIVIPIVLIYRKFYGWNVTWRMVSIMFVTMVLAALAVDGIFSGAGIVPTHRPSIDSITSRGIEWNYTTALNIVAFVVFGLLFGLTLGRGVKDPVCGMTVDRHKAQFTSSYQGRTVHFCSASCKARFDADPAATPSVPTEHGVTA